MTKVQRARLAVLSALSAAELTAAQKTELADLQTLAAKNPDASKDTEAPAAGATATPAPAAAPTAKTVISAAINALRNKNSVAVDLATANQQLSTLTQERDQARNDLLTATQNNAALKTQVEAFAAFMGCKASELTGKDAAALNKFFEEKLSALVVDHVAGLGLATGQVPKRAEGDGKSDLAEMQAEYASLAAKDSMQAATYWQANIEPLIRKQQAAMNN